MDALGNSPPAPLQGAHDHFCVYDCGGSIRIEAARRSLEARYTVRDVPSVKGGPQYVTFAPALILEFGERGEFALADGTPCRVTAKLFEIGAISIRFSMRLQARAIKDLYRGWDFLLRQGDQTRRKEEVARGFFEEVQAELARALEDHYTAELRPERYSVFGIERPQGDALAWFDRNRRPLAGLLAGESSPERLASTELEEILNARFSYYQQDVVAVGPEAAVFVADTLKDGADVTAILELACLQVLELRAYDAYLDRVAEKAVDDLQEIYAPGGFLTRSAQRMVAELAETRAELEQMVDEIDNAAKFYGDWHLARFYLGCRKKLRVDPWLESVQKRLKTVGQIYALAASEATNRRLVLLEALIVLLIVFEIVMAFVRGH